MRGAHPAQSNLNILPRRILREIGAHNNFKAGASWPPVLRSPGAVQRFVICSDRIPVFRRSHSRGIQCKALKVGTFGLQDRRPPRKTNNRLTQLVASSENSNASERVNGYSPWGLPKFM